MAMAFQMVGKWPMASTLILVATLMLMEMVTV
jgi:hypothetical protein